MSRIDNRKNIQSIKIPTSEYILRMAIFWIVDHNYIPDKIIVEEDYYIFEQFKAKKDKKYKEIRLENDIKAIVQI